MVFLSFILMSILEETLLRDYQYNKQNITLIMEYIEENYTENMIVMDIAKHFNKESIY